jgi:peptidoglycan-associated lipoprotein
MRNYRLLVLMGLALAAVWILAGCACKYPQQEMDAARASIADAKAAEAPKYAPDDYKSAEDMLGKAEKQSSDNKCDDAKASAIEAVRLASIAKEVALSKKAELLKPAPVPVAAVVPPPAVLTLSTIYFDFDKSNIRDDQKATLEANAKSLLASTTGKVQIQGNCDERGTEEYNIALGQRRADAAKAFLVAMGVSADRITTISYGKDKPAVPGSDEAAWSKNRRDEFVQQ